MKKVFVFLLIFVLFLHPVFVSADMVDINTASLQQLDELKGIGLVIGQRIIDSRPYSSVDDLLRVKGIGPTTLQNIKDQGFACVNCQTMTTQNTTPSPTPAPTSTPLPTLSPTPTPAIIYPAGVFINEIMPNPKGPDETDEWIELYNSNNFDVDLSNWQIQDTVGTITTFTIPQNTKILAYGFLVFKRPETKIMINNDQDGLNLLTPDGKIADSVVFASAPLGQSYNKTVGVPSGSWTWSATLTPGAKNIIALVQTVSATAKTLSKAINSVKNNGVESELADLSQTTNPVGEPSASNGASPWFLFFTVLATTIILAAIVLLIKLRFYKKTT